MSDQTYATPDERDPVNDSFFEPIRQKAERKPGIACLPLKALMHVNDRFRLGASRYGFHNWRYQRIEAADYIDKAFRHIETYWDHESKKDKRTSALAAAIANLLILLDSHLHDGAHHAPGSWANFYVAALNSDEIESKGLPAVIQEAVNRHNAVA